MKMNKKGVNVLYSTMIFIILNLLFFSAMFLFVQRTTDNVSFTEQKYAKQIGVLVDAAKPGTIISINVNDFRDYIEKYSLNEEEIVSINDNVNVKLSRGEGYDFLISSNNKIDESFQEDENGDLILNLYVRENG